MLLEHPEISIDAKAWAISLLPEVGVINLGFERRIDSAKTDFGFVAKATATRLVEPHSIHGEKTFIVSHEYDFDASSAKPHIFLHFVDLTDAFSACPQGEYLRSVDGYGFEIFDNDLLRDLIFSLPQGSRSGFLGVVTRDVVEFRLQFSIYVSEVLEFFRKHNVEFHENLVLALDDLQSLDIDRLNLQVAIAKGSVVGADLEFGITSWEDDPPVRWMKWLGRHIDPTVASEIKRQSNSWWGADADVARWTHFKVNAQLNRVKNYLWLEPQ